MKVKKNFFFMFIACTLILGACTSSNSKKDQLTMKDSVKDGNVVVQVLGDKIIGGSFKVKNFKEVFLFAKHVKTKKKDKIKITLYNKAGKSMATSTLQYDGSTIHFIDHFKGFPTPTGDYQCKTMAFIAARAQVGGCKSKNEKQLTNAIVLFANSDKINQFVNQFLDGNALVSTRD